MKRAAVVILIVLGLIYVVARDAKNGLKGKLDDKFSLALRVDTATYCIQHNPCTFRLEQFLPGDWDRIVVFNPGTPVDEVRKTIGTPIDVAASERLVVFLQGTRQLRTVVEQPDTDDSNDSDYHLVDFTGVPTQDHHLTLTRGQLYQRAKGIKDTSCDNCVTLQALPANANPTP